jgi:tRNA modification GTPase
VQHEDTIAAIATPPGTGGVGVIRISGDQAATIGRALTGADFQPGKVQLRHFLDEQAQEIDHGLLLYFKAPRSFTGEDVVEIQGHGGAVVQDMLLSRVCHLGARIARPGEFSERAFHHGKLDLAQTEAIADLIESGSQAAARAAVRSLNGEFSSQVQKITEQVIELRSFVEAALDFADEEIDFLGESDITARLDQLIELTRNTLDQAARGRVLNEGLTLAIAGRPNAGKSSLLNHLAGYDAAIVSEVAGTTRDVIREHIALKGIPVRVIDTAGLRESDDPVEQEGVRRAWREIEQADLVLMLIDATQGVTDADLAIEQRLVGFRVQRVFTKADLTGNTTEIAGGLLISTRNGQGMDQLIDKLTGKYADFSADQSTFLARKRHVEALQQALDSLLRATNIFQQSASGELMAEDLRYAQQFLGEITGEFTTEDLLGRIFSSFCIGK